MCYPYLLCFASYNSIVHCCLIKRYQHNPNKNMMTEKSHALYYKYNRKHRHPKTLPDREQSAKNLFNSQSIPDTEKYFFILEIEKVYLKYKDTKPCRQDISTFIYGTMTQIGLQMKCTLYILFITMLLLCTFSKFLTTREETSCQSVVSSLSRRLTCIHAKSNEKEKQC